jgi:hypothetical protein
MSHIIIHRVEDIARRRLARIAQIEALPPAVPRHDGDHWDFNRIGWAKPFVPLRQARERAKYEDEPGAGELLPPPAPRARVARCPRRQSFALHLWKAAGPTARTCWVSSTPTIPYAWQVDSIHMRRDSGTFPETTINIYAGDEQYNNEIITGVPSGAPVFLVTQSEPAAGSLWEFPIGASIHDFMDAGTAEIFGAGPFPAGTRATFAMGFGVTTPAFHEVMAHLQISECLGGAAGFEFDIYPEPPPPAPVGAGAVEAPPYTEPPTFWRLG